MRKKEKGEEKRYTGLKMDRSRRKVEKKRRGASRREKKNEEVRED